MAPGDPIGLRDRARVWRVWATQAAGRAYALVRRRGASVTEVFPQVGGLRAHELAARMESHHHALSALRAERGRAGDAWLERVVEVRGAPILEALRGRAVVAFAWHEGLVGAIPAALTRAGREGIFLRDRVIEVRAISRFRCVEVGVDAQRRGRALAEMLEAARRRQVILVVGEPASDGDPSLPRVVMHGRRVVVSTGPALVARLTGAAIVPVAGTLRPGRVEVELFPPVVAGADDVETTARLARFFERRIAEAPGRLWRPSLDALRAAPLAPQGTKDAG